MSEYKYIVLLDGDPVAEQMDIDTATILLKALFAEYYNDPSMSITIVRMREPKGSEESDL